LTTLESLASESRLDIVFLLEYLQAAGFKHIYREALSQFGFPTEVISATL